MAKTYVKAIVGNRRSRPDIILVLQLSLLALSSRTSPLDVIIEALDDVTEAGIA